MRLDRVRWVILVMCRSTLCVEMAESWLASFRESVGRKRGKRRKNGEGFLYLSEPRLEMDG